MLGAKQETHKLIRMFGLPVVPTKTRKDHACTICAERIRRGRFAYRSATNAQKERRWCLECVQELGEVVVRKTTTEGASNDTD